jgi:hypothetical protein
MARPMQQTINCPQCGQPFNAILEQILDVGRDPSARDRLLSGRVNVVTCPHCGFQGMVSTPLMYHDPEKQLAIIYVPMQLNLGQEDREKLIGDMTNAVMRGMPDDAPKGYLLQPATALTLQGLTEQVLEAEGITREMIDAERRKIELIDQLAEAKKDEVDTLIEENQDLIDATFLELLRAAGQAAGQSGDNRTSLRLLNLRSRLMETTEAGQELKAREEAIVEASRELQALGEQGEGITRQQFVDLLVKAAGDPAKVEAYGVLGRNLLDYQTFQLLSEQAEKAESEEEADQIREARETLLEIAAEFEEQSRAVIERAANTLRTLLQTEDIEGAVRANLDRIDETFLAVLQANLEEARNSGQVEVSSRLKRIRDEVLRLMQQAAPPEIRLINDLLSAESDEAAIALLNERSDELSPDILSVFEDLIHQLRDAGNEGAADRLEVLRAEAANIV